MLVETRKASRTNARPNPGSMRATVKILFLAAMIFVEGRLSIGLAQPQPQPQPNPLMQLMLNQPPIDVTSPVVVTASFDPPAVRPGQKAIYRLTLNAIASNVRMPGKIPGLKKIEIGFDYGQGTDAADIVLYSEFESRDALAGYEGHAAHLVLAPMVRAVRTEKRVVDYEA